MRRHELLLLRGGLRGALVNAAPGFAASPPAPESLDSLPSTSRERHSSYSRRKSRTRILTSHGHAGPGLQAFGTTSLGPQRMMTSSLVADDITSSRPTDQSGRHP